MADLISDVVEQQAFDQVEKLQKGLNTLLATFNQLAGQNINFGGGSGGGSSAYVQALSELDKVKNKIVQTTERLSQAYLDEEAYLKRLQATQKEQSALNMAAAGSIDAMKARMKELERQINATADAQGKGAVTIQNLAKEYNNLNSQVSKHEQAMGNFKRNVGNYASAYNGMSIAISQVAREMPNFAQSTQIGLMSLTNNIGGLMDGYKGLIAQNERLKASGEATIPIWRGITSAIFSWNTLIMVGFTALSYFVNKMSDTKKEQEDIIDNSKKYNSTLGENIKLQGKEIGSLELLYSTATNVNLSMTQRKKAVDELQRLYPEYLKNLSDEAIMTGNASQAYEKLSEDLMKNAMFKAYSTKIESESDKIVELTDKLNALRKEQDKVAESDKKYYGSETEETRAYFYIQRLNILSEIDATKAEIKRLIQEAANYTTDLFIQSKDKKPKADKKIKRDKGDLSMLYGNIYNEWDVIVEELLKKYPPPTSLEKWQDGINKDAQDLADRLLAQFRAAMQPALDKANKKAARKADFEANWQDILFSGFDISNSVIEGAKNKLTAMTEYQISLIDAREQAELASLGRMTMSDEKRTEKKIELELKYKAQRDKLHREEVAQLRRMAIFQKGLDLSKIAINTAVAVSKDLGMPWKIAADIAIGAAMAAQVLAQQIPQYAKGTDNHKGGMAIVGEEGTELGILPSGKKFLTRNKPTLMNLPAKTKIIPHDQLVQSIYHNALIRMSEMGGVSSTDGMQEALIASVMDLKGEMHEMKNAILEKDMTVKLYGDVSKYAHLQRQLR